MKRIAYFLSYAYSMRDAVEYGTVTRVLKELKYLAQNFHVDAYSKDNQRYLDEFSNTHAIENVAFKGLAYSPYYGPSDKKPVFFVKLARRVKSLCVLAQYYYLNVLLHKKDFEKTDAFFVYHVSGGMASVLYKNIFRRSAKVIVRYNWNWGHHVKASRNNFEYSLFLGFERFILRNADMIIAGNGELKNQASLAAGAKANIIIIPNWIDCQQFCPQENKKEFDIIAVGRLAPIKNHKLLLEAAKIYKDKNKLNLKILLIGRGELKKELADYARLNQLDVVFVDRVSNDDMPSYLNKAKIFVLPSKYEGNPKILLEAMACGLPIVGTDIPGVRDIINDGHNGLIAEVDPLELADKIARTMSDGSFSARLGKNALGSVAQRFSMPVVMEATIKQIS